MEGLGVAANVIAVVDISSKVIGICIQYARDVKDAKAEQARLMQTVTNLYHASKGAQNLLEGPHGTSLKNSLALRYAVKDSERELESLETLLSTGQSTKFGAFKWPFRSKEVDVRIKSLERCSNAIDSALQVDQTAILIDHEIQAALDQLSVAQGAVYDSHADEHNPTCLEGTRTEILDDISRWMDDTNAKPIFWLNGMAGTGKSTISRTLAKRRHEKGDLVATFFFKNGEADRVNLNKFISTIARQLADQVPSTRCFLKDSIKADATILGKGIKEQFEKLILQPLSKANGAKADASSFVIVVDALDECHRHADIELLINVLSAVAKYPSIKLRIFVTSRPELSARLGFNSIKGTYQDLILHEIEAPKVEHDIARFLRHELEKIRFKFNVTVSEERKVSSNWLTEEDLQRLVRMAAPLFIVAATICRFVSNRRGGDPEVRLETFLCQAEETHGSRLGMIYGPVLNQQLEGLSKTETEQIIAEFRLVVGTIVILYEPLSAQALSQLLDCTQSVVGGRLDLLHSVLNVPEDPQMPVRPLHLSFRDYLLDLDSKSVNKFWINEGLAHHNMTSHCLRIMQTNLRTDICDLRRPGILISEIDPRRVEQFLPPELQYACLHWVDHCVMSIGREDMIETIRGFLKKHLLHWLEVFGLMRHLWEAGSTLGDLRDWVGDRLQGSDTFDLRKFLEDGQKLVDNVKFCDAPLQIYSALAFESRDSRLRRTLTADIPDWLSLQSSRATVPGGSRIRSALFSPDSKLVALFSSYPGVDIWGVEPRKHIKTLKSKSDMYFGFGPAGFSPNSKTIAFVLDRNHVGVWELETAMRKQKFSVAVRQLRSLAFSPDSKLVALGFMTGTSSIWNIESGECLHIFRGKGDIQSVEFSTNMRMMASALYCKTELGRIWNLETGRCERVLQWDAPILRFGVPSRYAAAFSRDSKTVAMAARRTLRVWNMDTGECIKCIKTTYTIDTLHFRDDDTVIHTNFGEVSLINAPTASLASSAVPESEWHLGYFKETFDWWVTCNNIRLFSVPVNTGTWIVVSGLNVVLRDGSGQIWFMKFTVDLLKRLTSSI